MLVKNIFICLSYNLKKIRDISLRYMLKKYRLKIYIEKGYKRRLKIQVKFIS